MDGQPISSCLQLAALAQGRQITTVEGLTENGQLHPVQQAYVDHTAFQCSYCTPGFVLATVGLLTDIEDPSTAEIEEYLAGNLCRCGSYVKIRDAVLQAKISWPPPRDRSAAPSSMDKRPEEPH
jgi:Aerobic-type carbon monoxide dehydrogenase, small subunit CoxS/CutS homologs